MNKSDPHICARCHGLKQGCCVLGQCHVEHMFGLTAGEIKIISRASGLKAGQFVEQDEITFEFERTLKQLHPVFAQTMPDRKRNRLKVNRAGRCVFLGPEGCRLPSQSRPLYCRLYPFWFKPSGGLMILLSETCLAQERASSVDEVLARMGADKAELKELFSRLKILAKEHYLLARAGDGA